jgi:maltose alpha-D-glucosyltransferase/alpha-amylase
MIVNNLSRFSQPIELDLRRFAGWTPVELFGETPFPQITEAPFAMSLGPHGFMWFRLEPPTGGETVERTHAASDDVSAQAGQST